MRVAWAQKVMFSPVKFACTWSLFHGLIVKVKPYSEYAISVYQEYETNDWIGNNDMIKDEEKK